MPNFDDFVATATDKNLPIQAEGEGQNIRWMAFNSSEQLPSRKMPNCDGIVGSTRTDKSLPIRAEDKGIIKCRLWNSSEQVPMHKMPKFDGVVATATDKSLPIRADG